VLTVLAAQSWRGGDGTAREFWVNPGVDLAGPDLADGRSVELKLPR